MAYGRIHRQIFVLSYISPPYAGVASELKPLHNEDLLDDLDGRSCSDFSMGSVVCTPHLALSRFLNLVFLGVLFFDMSPVFF